MGSVEQVESNWSGTYQYQATELHRPTNLADLQLLVSRAQQLHAIGSRHSFNDIADSAELVTTDGLGGEPELDSARQRVRVPGSLRYGVLAQFLQDRGWALANLASLPHISIAGSVATATHGSGIRNQSLASAVTALTVVCGGGEVITLDEDAPELSGAVVHLGALGVVTDLTLKIEPTFDVRQDVYEYLPWESLVGSFDQVMATGYSVSVMTNFADPHADKVWVKTRLPSAEPGDPGEPGGGAAELFGARLAEAPLHPTRGYDPTHCTPQLGQPGPWCDRLPHFLLQFTPSTGAEIHSEYLFDQSRAAEVIQRLRSLGQVIAPRVKSAEIRTVAADELWLSPAYQTDCAAVHFTWNPDPVAVRDAVTEIEHVLRDIVTRPHWGKVFGRPSRPWDDLYPRLAEFRALAATFDPRGVFRNEFLARTVFAEPA